MRELLKLLERLVAAHEARTRATVASLDVRTELDRTQIESYRESALAAALAHLETLRPRGANEYGAAEEKWVQEQLGEETRGLLLVRAKSVITRMLRGVQS